MYTPHPKGMMPKMTKIIVHDDFDGWMNANYTSEMHVDLLGLVALEDGTKPSQLENFYVVDSDEFLWEIISKPTALWIWDNYKQAGEPEICILAEGPFDNDYITTLVENRKQIVDNDSQVTQPFAVALGFKKELKEVTDER
tara:strand:+ start:844 stop:1266 length:423 start_codon:yes stop_codon:yes gene_type:complete